MANFIRCSCENTEYKSYKFKNSPINIELVMQVEKIVTNVYPDNEGTPAIAFHTNTELTKTWVYEKNQLAQRDSDYERIISTK